MEDIFARTRLLLGDEGLARLAASRVAVFGVGGVGGFAVEALARSGVGALDLIDSDTVDPVRYDPINKPGVANLMNIYSAVTGKSFHEIEAEFAGQGYGRFKPAVGDAVIETLRPIREEATRILADKAYLESVYKAGAEKASYAANKTLRKVYKKLGFVPR